ncbi:hypothetical protein CBER1_01055 [Cercospora berteroae]|uniref:Uncharacterized protein n=1 Tax=Cercospora berteroae TaxID=357750 RepID=A0A2S6C350_9PEZI|nr:hypothetical protein CBER1_01055 [Cercospora berteroae]
MLRRFRLLFSQAEPHSSSKFQLFPAYQVSLFNQISSLRDTELGPDATIPVSLGVTGAGVRAVLVSAATAINARVLNARYSVNANGSVTADFIQPDEPVLRCLVVKEIHDYDLETCEIIRSNVYGFGKIITRGPNDVFCE